MLAHAQPLIGYVMGTKSQTELWLEAIGATLRELRKEAGMTQTDIAQMLGMTTGGISKVELGGSNSFSTIMRYAEALDASFYGVITAANFRVKAKTVDFDE